MTTTSTNPTTTMTTTMPTSRIPRPEPWPAPTPTPISRRPFLRYISLETLARGFDAFSAGCISLALYCIVGLVCPSAGPRSRSELGTRFSGSNMDMNTNLDENSGIDVGGMTRPWIVGTSRVGYGEGYYRCLLPLLIPTCAWFAIAHWIGWEFYRNSEEDTKA